MKCMNAIVATEGTPAPEVLAEIKKLTDKLKSHRALDNGFYRLWMSEQLSGPQLRVFANNYYHRIYPTVDRLARAFVVTEDLVSRAAFVQNINDELGDGDANGAHVRLLARWLDGLLKACTGEGFDVNRSDADLLPATRRLTEQSLKLCSSSAPAANGAILAQEWHAYMQLVNIYEGFRNYLSCYDLEDFHNQSEYFYIHIGWAEKEHKEQSILTAARSCKSASDIAELGEAYLTMLDLIADFWDALHDAIRVEADQGFRISSAGIDVVHTAAAE
jgi:pyrroloquinoline quinone (PQQ) biosynthesis protein C